MSDGITKWSNRPEELEQYWLSNPDNLPDYRVQMLALIEKEMKENPNSTIMDCGCGTGLVFQYLKEEYKERYFGVDFTQDMIDYCIKKNPKYADHFMRVDLTSIDSDAMMFFNGHHLYITQNVIQHIMLWQIALENIFYACDGTILLCERTHNLNTVLVGYEPAYRWRFNVQDFYDVMTYFNQQFNYNGDVKIVGTPKTTDNLEDCLTIFKVQRNKKDRITHDELEYYINELFIREKTVIRKWLPRKTKRERIQEYIKNKVSSYYTTIKNWVKAQVFEPVPSPSP